MRSLASPSRRAPDARLLASHDAASLAAHLASVRGASTGAESTAARVLRHAFGPDAARVEADGGAVAWDEASLGSLGVGAWAHGALLAHDVAVSLAIEARAPAADGTERLLLRAGDGALVETVIIPGPARTTLCLSSQVGCARACAFCETGRLGLERQLSAGEIVDQVRIARALVVRERRGPPVQNLVFMGMGEPFDNLPEVTRAIRLLTDPRAFAFTPSHVTVSTVGVADKLETFFAGCRAELAVSLNAPDDERRAAIMPIDARFSLDALERALVATLPRGRKVLFEYVVFDAFNDAPEDADLLAALVARIPCRVNVIPCNPGPDPALRPPRQERVDAFVARLASHGVTTLVRRPRGRDVGGACGQLAGARRLPLAIAAD